MKEDIEAISKTMESLHELTRKIEKKGVPESCAFYTTKKLELDDFKQTLKKSIKESFCPLPDEKFNYIQAPSKQFGSTNGFMFEVSAADGFTSEIVQNYEIFVEIFCIEVSPVTKGTVTRGDALIQSEINALDKVKEGLVFFEKELPNTNGNFVYKNLVFSYIGPKNVLNKLYEGVIDIGDDHYRIPKETCEVEEIKEEVMKSRGKEIRQITENFYHELIHVTKNMRSNLLENGEKHSIVTIMEG